MSLLLFLAGLGLLALGAELLVRGASRLATSLGISPLVVGLIVVAYGTSAPEVAVSVRAALNGQADIALGNVVGSNIYNVLLILGAAALVAPLAVHRRLVRLDVPLMIGVSLLVYGLGLDGRISRFDGAMLLLLAAAYTVFTIRLTPGEPAQIAAAQRRAAPRGFGSRAADLGLTALGLALLVVGARWLVESATHFARAFGVSELVIGLTVVAFGTSLPELATSLLAALRGQREIAVGNVVGSNIFNLVWVLGAAAALSGRGVAVPQAALAFDLPVMIVVALACLPIAASGHRVDRWEGALFLAYAAAYTAYLVLQSQENAALPLFSSTMLLFVLPLTAASLVLVAMRLGRPTASP